MKMEETYYGPSYFVCQTCNRDWAYDQVKRAYEAPFSHTLWDFVNQNPETIEYDFAEDDTDNRTGKK